MVNMVNVSEKEQKWFYLVVLWTFNSYPFLSTVKKGNMLLNLVELYYPSI